MGVGSSFPTSHEEFFAHNNTVSNSGNKKSPLKERNGLWITPNADDRVWMLVIWLMSKDEVRQALFTTEPTQLPVISY